MRRLNWDIIARNIADAREQLERLEARINRNDPPRPVEFQVMMQHAHHHLNFAWNARHWPTRRYESLSEEDFEAAGKLPTDLDFDD